MKLKKITLNEVSQAELNEKEMLRILGGGTPGCCQCGCNYSGTGGGSSTSSNNSANNAKGLTSDGSHPCCDTSSGTGSNWPVPPPPNGTIPQSTLCPGSQGYSCAY